MEGLKNRVGAFTEGILTMAYPVLLAVALNKVSLNNEESRIAITGAIYLAVANLTISLCAFAFLVFATTLRIWNHELLLVFFFDCSMVLVHVCAILQSILAYMILRIKTDLQGSVSLLVVCILFSFFPVLWCILSARTRQRQEMDLYAGFHDKLEQSLDVLASVTSFLFQVLVAFSFESPDSNGQDNSVPLVFTFIFCMLATCCMLVGAVLCPIQFINDGDKLCMYSQIWCLALTMILTIVVPMLTKQCIETEWAVGMVMFPWISVGAVFLLGLCTTRPGDDVRGEDEAKPAPLGLTKAMFAGFLSLLIPSFNSRTVSGSTKAFIVITAGVVISGLLWRLLTHLAPMRAAVIAADAACLLTLLLVTAAGISFVLVAKDAFAQRNLMCQSPCTTGQQIKDSILTCFSNNMTEFQGKKWTAVLSCVSC